MNRFKKSELNNPNDTELQKITDTIIQLEVGGKKTTIKIVISVKIHDPISLKEEK